jgi:hypothetical protein
MVTLVVTEPGRVTWEILAVVGIGVTVGTVGTVGNTLVGAIGVTTVTGLHLAGETGTVGTVTVVTTVTVDLCVTTAVDGIQVGVGTLGGTKIVVGGTVTIVAVLGTHGGMVTDVGI